jgi:hypothetical protein
VTCRIKASSTNNNLSEGERIMKLAASSLIITSVLVCSVSEAGQVASNVGNAIDHAAVATREAVVHGAEQTVKTLEHGYKQTVKTLEHGAKETGKSFERGFDKTMKGLEVAVKVVGKGLEMYANSQKLPQPQGPRMFHQVGCHKCICDTHWGYFCRVEGTNFLDEQEAWFRLKQDDCCPRHVHYGQSVTGARSVEFRMIPCEAWR